jgi:Na+/H+ antiporter NhaC
MSLGLISVLLILFVVIGAIATKRVEICLFLASFIGIIILYPTHPLTQMSSIFQEALINNAWVMLIVGLFGCFISLLQSSNGHLGFSKIVDKVCNTEKKTMVATFIMGIVIFIEELLNAMTIGACMKNHYDKQKIPRESLAYMLDATGGPICVMVPISGWGVCLTSIFVKEKAFQDLGTNPVKSYLMASPMSFYSLITLVICFLFCIGVMPKLGAMKKAYERVEKTGMVYSEKSRRYNQQVDDNVQDGKIVDFLVPIGVLIALTLITGDLMTGVITATITCAVMYIPRKIVTAEELFPIMLKGFYDMLPVDAVLLLTYALQIVTDKMGMTEYIINAVRPYMFAQVFPVIIFLLVATLCFCTASLVGVCAIVVPIALPLGALLGCYTPLVMAAVMSGAGFGSHACFYADATLVSSRVAGIDNLEHAVSQLPYVLIGGGLSIVAFLAAGVIMA